MVFCRVSFVVLKHLRAVNAGLRARGIRESDLEHAEHVQDSKARNAYGLNGDATDMAGVILVMKTSGGWSDESTNGFAAGFSQFGTISRSSDCDFSPRL